MGVKLIKLTHDGIRCPGMGCNVSLSRDREKEDHRSESSGKQDEGRDDGPRDPQSEQLLSSKYPDCMSFTLDPIRTGIWNHSSHDDSRNAVF